MTDNQLVDWIRFHLGLLPLHAAKPEPQPAGTYLSAERLSRAADPGCARCSGSGYYDGEHLDMRCPCTRLPQRTFGGGTLPGHGNSLFGRVRRTR